MPARLYNPLFEDQYEKVRKNLENKPTKILLHITKERGKFSFSCGIIQQGFEMFFGGDSINCLSESLEKLNSIFAYIDLVVEKHNVACVFDEVIFKDFRQMACNNYLSYHPLLAFSNGDNFALPKHVVFYPLFFKNLNKQGFKDSIEAHYALSGNKHMAIAKAMLAELFRNSESSKVLELSS